MGILELKFAQRKFDTLINNGDNGKRFNIAIVGDGYRDSELGKYHADVNKIIDGFRSTEPIRTYFNHFNFHRVNVISPESGIKDDGINPPFHPKTALDCYFDTLLNPGPDCRRVAGLDVWIQSVIGMAGATADGIIVVCNYPVYGGATGVLTTVGSILAGVCYVTACTKDRRGNRTDSFHLTAVHEASHAFVHLADEYSDDQISKWPPCLTAPFVALGPAAFPNVDSNAQHPKWHELLTPHVHLPTQANAGSHVVGAFEGAFYASHGVFRPQANCIMNSDADAIIANNIRFCAVCNEQWIKTIYNKTRIADSFSIGHKHTVPDDKTNITFSANGIKTHDIKFTWSKKKLLDQHWALIGNAHNHQFSSTFSHGFAGETWQVKLEMEDLNSGIITQGIKNGIKQTNTWTFFISPVAVG